MMSSDQRWASEALTSARPNGGGSRVSSTSVLGHKRTNSGRIESKEDFKEEGDHFSSPDLSGGSGSKPQPSYSPIIRPYSRLHRNTTSDASPRGPESPRDTQIPRPKTAAPNIEPSDDRRTPGSVQGLGRRIRQPIGLKAAFKLAEAQEARDRSGSSSSSGSIDLKQAFKMANAEANRVAAGSPSPAPRSYRRRESIDTRSNQYFGSPNQADLGQRLQEFDRKHQLGSSGGNVEGLFTTKGRVGPKVAETATTLARKVSNSSLENSPERRRDSLSGQKFGKQSSAEIPKRDAARRNSLLPSVEFGPLPPVEIEENNELASSPVAGPINPSPEKSYNWNFDADFTAGDLQVSDSPRVKLGRNSSTNGDLPAASYSQYRGNNDKLAEIRELEVQAAKAEVPEDESSPAFKKTNSKLDEIRARELVALSPRVVAESRLEEIRAKNAAARSPSTSPEEARTSSKQTTKELPSIAPSAKDAQGNKTSLQAEGLTDKDLRPSTAKQITSKLSQPPIHDDSYDLLRRLEQATSSSPSPNNSPQPPERQLPIVAISSGMSEGQEISRPRSTREARRSRDMRVKSSRDRLTVGFAGLHKVPSSDSTDHKRRSLHSETDPVDRIEAEMNLFALLDNQSEKSSTRASSPGLTDKSEPIDEETPKPKRRVDPLTMPTPRVTGAYVETPATVKAERDDDWIDVESDMPVLRKGVLGRRIEEPKESNMKREDDELPDKFTNTTGKSSSAPTRRPKTRPRHKQPLVNTAQIPSVKEDLRAILRQHRIDDSTLDDFEGLFDEQDIDADDLEKIVGETVLKIEEDLKMPGLTDRERELQAYDRMSKSLQTGLLGIRSAKQGIERLEDKVTHAEKKGLSTKFDIDLNGFANPVPLSLSSRFGAQSAYVTWPALYRRQPRVRLTPLGMIALLFAIWYTIESAFCFFYVERYECPRGMLCDWSPNEPYFPYAAPFMLDEWTTGGKGRALAWRVGDKVGDVAAEVSDWATGHDFRKDEMMYMNIWERKRHRRRLNKRGLYWKWTEPVQFRHKFQAWRNAWTERQRAFEDGEAIWVDESMSGDQRL